jgi:flagellar hook-associated protein 2
MALGSVSNAFPNGRPSGLPVDIVDQIVQAKSQQRLTPIQYDINEAENEKDAYSALNSKLVGLYKAADSLNTSSEFNPTSAASTDTDVATASASSGTPTGTYSVSVSTLAEAHRLVVGVQDAGDGVNTGISDAAKSSLIESGVTLSLYHEGTVYSYTTDADTTLNSLAAEINSADNGVSAQALNIGTADAPQYVLSLKSQETGDGTKQITTDVAGTATGVTLSSTLFAGETTEQETTQCGQDAVFTVDGLGFSRSSNAITDVISGVTLNLKDQGEAQINVTLGKAQITSKVGALVSAFNAVETFYDNNASYDQTTGVGGILLGDSIARGAEMRIDTIFREPVPGTVDNTYQYLSEVGIEFKEDGTLEFDSEAFQEALENDPEAVAALFVGENGAAGRLCSSLQAYTDTYDGILSARMKALENDIDELNLEYSEEQAYLEDYRERLSWKYTNLEKAVLKYQSLQEQLESILDMWDTGGD